MEGDTAESVVARYGVDPVEFAVVNPATNPFIERLATVNPGEKVNIPPCAALDVPKDMPTVKCGFMYTLAEGDNVWQIAQYYGVNFADVMWANPGLPTLLDMTPGTTINIPQHCESPAKRRQRA
jgi:LysM repeat protein